MLGARHRPDHARLPTAPYMSDNGLAPEKGRQRSWFWQTSWEAPTSSSCL
jgi:hypothetical protein